LLPPRYSQYTVHVQVGAAMNDARFLLLAMRQMLIAISVWQVCQSVRHYSRYSETYN